jgi:DNA polymerase III psi subunit
MIEERRRAYLEALGYDVWVARPPAPEPGRLSVGVGGGSTLLVCDAAGDCSTELARDLVRTVGGEPAWAWLDPVDESGGEALGDVVSGRLITRILLFGRGTAQRLFQGSVPEIVGSATVMVVPALQELAVSGLARQTLWQQLRKWQRPAGGH